MTCVEKYREIYPEWDKEQIRKFPLSCPHDVYIAPRIKCCEKVLTCETCWSREIPEEKHNLHKFDVMLTGDDMRRFYNLSNKLPEKTHADIIGAALLLFEDTLNAAEMGIVGVDAECDEEAWDKRCNGFV